MKNKHKKTHKRKAIFRTYRAGLLVAVFGLELCGFGAQLRANLNVQRHSYPHESAVTLAAPEPSQTPLKTPAPTPVPTPPSTQKQPAHRVASAKPAPAVRPAPGSDVSHLVPVLQSSPVPTATPTPAPGRGSGAAPATYAYTSTNWSGYLASGGNYTSVTGAWAVPRVSGNGASTSADATWIGIGGVTSDDLIQVGTTDIVSARGQVSSTAFYELLPAAETPVPGMTIGSGDSMSANIHQLSSTKWQISIDDLTRGENFSITVTYTSSLSTAEWIQEDPSYASGGLVPFDDFGLINFSGASAIENGAPQTLATAGAQAIIMVNSHGSPVATPSAIGPDGKSFSVSGG
jgi:hypothetical protein